MKGVEVLVVGDHPLIFFDSKNRELFFNDRVPVLQSFVNKFYFHTKLMPPAPGQKELITIISGGYGKCGGLCWVNGDP